MKPSKEMKLTSLGVDCLERILRYLPLDDLMNVADSNKQLKEAADLVFVLKNGNKGLLIYGFCSSPNKFFLEELNIVCFDLKTTLQLMRCFGHLIPKLKFDINKYFMDNFELLDIHVDRVIIYIKQYCVESLTEFNILNAPAGILDSFVSPFPNVRSVCVRSSDLKNISLLELFPNMKRLTYHCDKVIDFASIESNVPALDHLEIISCSDEDDGSLRSVRLNPKLQSLSVPFFAIYQGLNEALSHLTVLRVNKINRWPETYDSVKFHFETVKRLEILYHGRFTQIPFSFDNLEELILKFIHQRSLQHHHEKFYDFILQHPSIINLKIEGDSPEVNLSKLMNMLPLVKEFDVCNSFLIQDVIRFLNKKETLKIMKVYLKKHFPNRDEVVVQMQLNEDWHLGKTSGYKFIFKRN